MGGKEGGIKKAVLLLSGGIDSATCGAIAKSEGFALFVMSFSYGQRHAIELESAKKVAAYLGVAEHRIVACGQCDSCQIRKKGFEEAGVEDPTRYCI